MTIENIRLGSDQILVADTTLKLPLYVVREGLHPRRNEVHPGTVLHDICLWVIQDHLDKAKAAKAQAGFNAGELRDTLERLHRDGHMTGLAHGVLCTALANAAKPKAPKDPATVNLGDVTTEPRAMIAVEPCVRDFIRNLEEMVFRVATGVMEDRERRGD